MTHDEVVEQLQMLIDRDYDSNQKLFCEANDISEAYVSAVLKKQKGAGQKLLDILELEKVVTYRRKGK